MVLYIIRLYLHAKLNVQPTVRCSMACVSVGHIHEHYRMVEPTIIPFGVWTLVSPRNRVSHGAWTPGGRGIFVWAGGEI